MRASTPPITGPDGRPLPGSIASLETPSLGGVRQSVLLRGRDTANPVLLFLHGGPGTSELGILRAHNLPALEARYTVAVWDQRGAGKSFAAREPRAGMTVEQLLEDTLELSELLGRRFGGRRIFLAGHSWGSLLGVLAVARRPELFHAWIGVGQVAHMLEGERASYDWTLARPGAAATPAPPPGSSASGGRPTAATRARASSPSARSSRGSAARSTGTRAAG